MRTDASPQSSTGSRPPEVRQNDQPMDATRRLTIERIRTARASIDPVFLNSAQFEHPSLDRALGLQLMLKVETINPVRSFKGRGSSWLLTNTPPTGQVVCASAGNFGQAPAYCPRSTGHHITVFAARNANPFKVEAMKTLGATVHLDGEYFDAARAAARRYAAATSARLVVDSLDIETAEGAGTIALELLEGLLRRNTRRDDHLRQQPHQRATAHLALRGC